MHYVQWPQELDAQLEIPTDGAEGGTPKSKIRRNEKTGVWSHQEGNDEDEETSGESHSDSQVYRKSTLIFKSKVPRSTHSRFKWVQEHLHQQTIMIIKVVPTK